MLYYLIYLVGISIILFTGPIAQFITKKHEIAHAKEAQRQGVDVFIVLKDAKLENEYVDELEGIKTFHITPERFNNCYDMHCKAIAIHNTKVYNKNAMKITMAGLLESSKWYLLIMLLYTAGMSLICLLFNREFLFGQIGMNFFAVIVTMCVIIHTAWWYSKESICKMERQIKEKIELKDKEMKICPVSDGTKLRYRKKYAECYKMIQEHPDLFESFEQKAALYNDLNNMQNKLL